MRATLLLRRRLRVLRLVPPGRRGVKMRRRIRKIYQIISQDLSLNSTQNQCSVAHMESPLRSKLSYNELPDVSQRQMRPRARERGGLQRRRVLQALGQLVRRRRRRRRRHHRELHRAKRQAEVGSWPRLTDRSQIWHHNIYCTKVNAPSPYRIHTMNPRSLRYCSRQHTFRSPCHLGASGGTV